MENTKIDVCVCLYGKPYHTILAIKSLLKFSRQHIGTIYVVEEMKQPQGDLNGGYLLRQVFANEPVVFFKPSQFYNLGALDAAQVRVDEAYRYSIPYQYVLEKSDKKYVMVMHNDCLFHGDIVEKMLSLFAENNPKLAGVGPIGQCWNCPAFFEKKCDGATYDKFKPSQQEASELMARHEIPRREITERLIAENRVHPLPECRLNEYAALIDTEIYRKTTLPLGDNVTYAGAWDGNDWGTVWFYQMVNQGFDFKHIVLEDYAKHAPFNSVGNGISAYSNKSLYWETERLAKEHLDTVYGGIPKATLTTQVLSSCNSLKHFTKKKLLAVYFAVRKIAGMN